MDQTTHTDEHGPHGAKHDAGGGSPAGHTHPGARRYLEIAFVLAILTAIEVAVFYTPQFRAVLVPVLLVLSAVKFALVVLFYMHLKFDHKVFSGFFIAPLALAMAVMVSLLFLFRVLVMHGPGR